MIDTSVILENDYLKAIRTLYNSDFRMDEHSHGETAISYVFEGRNFEKTDVHQHVFGKNSLIIKPAGLPHNNQYSNNCLIFCIYLKKSIHLPLRLEKALHEAGNVQSFNFLPILDQLQKCRSAIEFKHVIKSMLERLGLQADRERATQPPSWLIAIKKNLEQSYHESITTEALAGEVNKHPVYVARAFRKHYGVSIKEYQNLQRSNAAVSQMTVSNDSLSQIALASGFADQSHMNRKIKEFSGLTPLGIRHLVR